MSYFAKLCANPAEQPSKGCTALQVFDLLSETLPVLSALSLPAVSLPNCRRGGDLLVVTLW